MTWRLWSALWMNIFGPLIYDNMTSYRAVYDLSTQYVTLVFKSQLSQCKKPAFLTSYAAVGCIFKVIFMTLQMSTSAQNDKMFFQNKTMLPYAFLPCWMYFQLASSTILTEDSAATKSVTRIGISLGYNATVCFIHHTLYYILYSDVNKYWGAYSVFVCGHKFWFFFIYLTLSQIKHLSNRSHRLNKIITEIANRVSEFGVSLTESVELVSHQIFYHSG